jgi:hypothetical protein
MANTGNRACVDPNQILPFAKLVGSTDKSDWGDHGMTPCGTGHHRTNAGGRAEMIGKLIRNFIKRHAVDEVPDEMSACQECRELQCLNDRYQTCPNRLAEAAALTAARTTEADAGSAAESSG